MWLVARHWFMLHQGSQGNIKGPRTVVCLWFVQLLFSSGLTVLTYLLPSTLNIKVKSYYNSHSLLKRNPDCCRLKYLFQMYFFQTGKYFRLMMTNLPLHLVVGQIVTFMHPKWLRHRADVVRHQVLLLQLIVEVGQVLEALLAHQSSLVGLVDVASLPEEPRPQLDPDNAEDEEDEEAEEEDVAQHGQSVQQQHHQDPHTWHGSQ